MSKAKERALAIACGLISAVLNYYVIPRFFSRGVPDALWMALMVILPAVVAAVLLRGCAPKCVLWGLLAECLTAVILCKPIGELLGYRLESIAWDLFDYIAYFMFALGWALAAAAAQFAVLTVFKKFLQKQNCIR